MSLNAAAACDDDDSDLDAAYNVAQALSQQESDEVESACGARSESGTEASCESHTKRFTTWWVRVIYSAVVSLGKEWPESPDSGKPIQVVSACTGCSAEASVLKAVLVLWDWETQKGR